MSKEEVDTLVAPHSESVSAVDHWLAHHGLASDSVERSLSGNWLTLKVTVAQAERMLNNKYAVYHHPKSSEYVLRALSYSLPRTLHEHVNTVTPTTYFSTLRSMRSTSFIQPEVPPVEDFDGPVTNAVVPTSCNTRITPACLQGLYNVTGYVPKATAVNRLGVAGYLGEFANRAVSLDLYQLMHSLTSPGIGLEGGQNYSSHGC